MKELPFIDVRTCPAAPTLGMQILLNGEDILGKPGILAVAANAQEGWVECYTIGPDGLVVRDPTKPMQLQTYRLTGTVKILVPE